MKIKNITDAKRKCFDRATGEIIIVGPFEVIEREKLLFDKRTFELVNTDIEEKVEEKIPKLLGKKIIKRRNK
jgi:hypothetical protein